MFQKNKLLTLGAVGVLVITAISLLPSLHLSSSVLEDFPILIDDTLEKPLSELSQEDLEKKMSELQSISLIKEQQRKDLSQKIEGEKQTLSVAQSSLPALQTRYEAIVKHLAPAEKRLKDIMKSIGILEGQITGKQTRKTYCEGLIAGLPGTRTSATNEKNALTIDTRLERPGSVPSLKAAIVALEKEQKVWEGKKKFVEALIERAKFDSKKQAALYAAANGRVTAARSTLKSLGVSISTLTTIEKSWSQQWQQLLSDAATGIEGLTRVSAENPGRIAQKKKELDTVNTRVTELTKTLADIVTCPGEIKTIPAAIKTLQDQINKPLPGHQESLAIQRGATQRTIDNCNAAKKDLDDATRINGTYPAIIREEENQLGEYDTKIVEIRKALHDVRRVLQEKYQIQFDDVVKQMDDLQMQYSTLNEQKSALLTITEYENENPLSEEELAAREKERNDTLASLESQLNTVAGQIHLASGKMASLQEQAKTVLGRVLTATPKPTTTVSGGEVGAETSGSAITIDNSGLTSGGITGGDVTTGGMTGGTGGGPVCGNGVVEGEEECDGVNIAGSVCTVDCRVVSTCWSDDEIVTCDDENTIQCSRLWKLFCKKAPTNQINECVEKINNTMNKCSSQIAAAKEAAEEYSKKKNAYDLLSAEKWKSTSLEDQVEVEKSFEELTKSYQKVQDADENLEKCLEPVKESFKKCLDIIWNQLEGKVPANILEDVRKLGDNL